MGTELQLKLPDSTNGHAQSDETAPRTGECLAKRATTCDTCWPSGTKTQWRRVRHVGSSGMGKGSNQMAKQQAGASRRVTVAAAWRGQALRSTLRMIPRHLKWHTCIHCCSSAAVKGLAISSVPAMGATTITAVPRHTCGGQGVAGGARRHNQSGNKWAMPLLWCHPGFQRFAIRRAAGAKPFSGMQGARPAGRWM